MFGMMVVIMVGFGVLHSLLAARQLKQFIRQQIGDRAYEGFYRIVYNLVAFGTLAGVGICKDIEFAVGLKTEVYSRDFPHSPLAPILLLVLMRPGAVIWHVDGIIQVMFLGIQLVGIAGTGLSLIQIDVWRFAGLKQAKAYIEGEPLPLPDEALQLGGLYGFVRHPLYLFSLMVIWPMSTMTEAMLAFTIASTAYFALGSILEEAKLASAYGDIYVQYQRRVPWLIPLPRIRR